jgi:hypothetical protein
MNTTVTIPVSLLNYIIEMLDGLDVLKYGGLNTIRAHGDILQALRESTRKIEIREICAQIIFMDYVGFKKKDYLRKEMEEYLLPLGDITEDEKSELYDWVASGCSAYENPYLISDGFGEPMDFIQGCRVGFDMHMNPSDYFGGEYDAATDECGDDDMPF